MLIFYLRNMGASMSLLNQLWRFSAIGAMGSVLDLLTFQLLLEIASFPTIIANSAAILISATFVYLANRNANFGRARLLASWDRVSAVRFVITGALALLVSNLTLLIYEDTFTPSNEQLMLVKSGTILALAAGKFFAYRNFVFKTRSRI